MYPIAFTLPGMEIYSIWLASVVGALAAGAFVLLKRRQFGMSQLDITNAAAMGLVGAIVGAKALYLITAAPILWAARSILAQNRQLLGQLLLSGMVYYGGLLGFLAGCQWYVRRYGVNQARFWNLVAPAIPLFHAFARVGCFLNGCCYGRECPSFGIAFTHSLGSPNGVPYFPVQLVEAAGELGLFFVLAVYVARRKDRGSALTLYLVLYAVMRLLLEFLRGDEVRGIWLGLSTSQWISLGILAVLAVRWAKGRSSRSQEGAKRW